MKMPCPGCPPHFGWGFGAISQAQRNRSASQFGSVQSHDISPDSLIDAAYGDTRHSFWSADDGDVRADCGTWRQSGPASGQRLAQRFPTGSLALSVVWAICCKRPESEQRTRDLAWRRGRAKHERKGARSVFGLGEGVGQNLTGQNG